MEIKIVKLHPNAIIPTYSVDGDAGMDLTAVSTTVDVNGNRVYGTGLAIEIPKGFAGLIFPRSSVSKYGLHLANSIGLIDSGYRGEIICKFKPTKNFDTLLNPADKFKLQLETQHIYYVGDKIAQILILPLPKFQFIEVVELSNSIRNKGGFGSTGK